MATALSVRHLEKTYNNGFRALKGISFSVEEGDFYALLGPNGAGKSTTLGIISSLVNKSAGQVEVFGHSLDIDPVSVKQSLGVVPQEFNFNQFEKVGDIVLNQAGYYGITRRRAAKQAEKYLTLLDLWDKKDEPARFLSGGMKRRLMIVRALVHNPRLLILDEPTAGVDIEIRRSMWDFLKTLNKEGVTIILTTHYLEEAESLCRNIGIISKGEIIANTGMKSLLKQMNKSTFIADVTQTQKQWPTIKDLKYRPIDEYSLEFEIEKGESLNWAFQKLTEAKLNIGSIRPKTNRLEELFVDLVQSDKQVN